MTNPYKGLDDYCFWSRSMTTPPPGQIDPATRNASILPSHKVATMGSCFAQHLAKHIRASGLNYYVPESAPVGMSEQEATQKNYGVFSARYGNVYTVRQAVQLFERAFEEFSPIDGIWKRNGRFVDAFRPQIEPDGYGSIDEVKRDVANHLNCVRDVFKKADWFIFTLGLTEAWRSRLDGAIYPTAPGVAGGEFDSSKHEFVNFTCDEVQADLCLLIEKIRSVNPDVQILLTVSPVPLIATYENRHVWVSTTYSKAALRVAADVAERSYKNVIYFPSYEIITSPAAGGRYYADDLRQVTEIGVKHVMRMFSKHFFPDQSNHFATEQTSVPLLASLQSEADVVCDEEVIERALRGAGF
ncbi:GSCFA domain-containing protein [Nitrosomonas sp. Nm34]|uniref:GSCFA domain-containing protein n=1 Tax=Nitrosomonas sp. Nm34 TaxID=1881055 RepID=UPI0008E69263|nr:GSCFA domain-containing protein [Nitrosomonas sp. Nm34]SFI57798.1 GSCFA family protein [Nitrosomonas sp. Nm34]